MKQQSPVAGRLEKYRMKTRKEFFEEMEKIIPWKNLCRVISPTTPNLKAPEESL